MGKQDFRFHEVPDPIPDPGQVIVRVEAAAICGTDLHFADWESRPPIIPGHEVAGVIVEKAADVKHRSIGEAVALDPVQRCGKCYACTHDIPHLCRNTRHLGGEEAAGGWAEYVAIDAANAHRIPQGVSFTAASLTEPAAVCCQSFRRAALKKGESVLVIGDGPFGLLHAVIASILGAETIIAAGHYDERLSRIAEHSGAITCNTLRQELDETVAELTGGLGVDVAIEATGAGESPNLGIAMLRPRGTLVIFSYIWRPEPADFATVSMEELNVLGSCRSLGCFEPCLEWIAQGEIPADGMVDLQLPLRDVNEALRQLAERKKDIFKVVLLPQSHEG
jgi:L-iditol 2-dehydrogenase